jgi:hypothetical protein
VSFETYPRLPEAPACYVGGASQWVAHLTKKGPGKVAVERRKTPRKDWVLGEDEVGRAVLEWKVDPFRAKRMEEDPSARTYDFLERLDHPELELAEDPKKSATPRPAMNPYDNGAPTGKRKKRPS